MIPAKSLTSRNLKVAQISVLNRRNAQFSFDQSHESNDNSSKDLVYKKQMTSNKICKSKFRPPIDETDIISEDSNLENDTRN